jgi:23S rRNA (uridine2552-2'-O)-methyltransferase
VARSKTSKRWLKEHFDDPYVKQAQAQDLRSRACFKLTELQQKYQLIRPGQVIVDLGAAPGGWSQLAARWAKGCGSIIALDLLPIEPLEGVEFIQGDFTQDGPLAALEQKIGGQAVDLVLSDMAPNISGMQAVDLPRAMYLVELALDFARGHLKMGGSMLVKVFHGEGFDAFLSAARTCFSKVKIIKPKASRPRSREVYILARGFRGPRS